MKTKRGFLLSVDAIVAVGILLTLGVFLTSLTFTYSSVELRYQRLYSAGKDMLGVIENAKMSYVENLPIVQQYLSQDILVPSDMDRTILDIIGSFWATGNATWEGYAENLAEDIFEAIIPDKFNYELLIDDIVVYNRSDINNSEYVTRFSTVISGYAHGEPVTGYAARVFLSTVAKTASEYAYFGGYVGDGNITRSLELPTYESIIEAYMEMNAGSNFTLFINENDAGRYANGSAGGGNMSADKWVICNSTVNPIYCQNYFQVGENELEINFTTGQNMYIGGGYIKIKYNTSELDTMPTQSLGENATKKYWFPGIHGIINLYNSFHIPGQLNYMEAYVHYRTNHTTFLTIGNVTVFNNTEIGEQVVNINNATFFSMFDYSDLSQSTMPLHMSMENISHTMVSGEGVGDVVLVTDVSGSMEDCADYDIPYMCNYNCIIGSSKRCGVGDPGQCTGNICGGFCFIPYNHNLDCSMNKLEVAQEADNLFMSIVLNISGNRLGLVSYEDGVDRTLELTDNQNALEYEISQYQAYGGTCICCGINEAVSIINSQSNESRRKNIVVMSDGEANRDCDAQQGTGDAAEDARNAACDAFQNYGITVDAVGFGDDANETTMQAIANCGNGSYYFSNVTDLASTYEEIAEDWINASYFAQTIIVYNMSLNNMLYPDSYIMFNYTSPVDPFEYGEISLNLESPRFGDLTGTNPITDNSTGTKEGWFYVPEGTEIVDAKITSYSSRYWTDRLYLRNEVTNWTRVFWLGEFNQPYMTLGDPYIIQIPTSYVNPGENNSVRIGTGVSVGNSTGGSPDDMVLYTIRISGITLEGYSNVFPRAEGCSRTIWFDIDNDDVADNYANIEVGDNPDDIFDPEHDAVDDALMRLMDKLNFINDDNPDGYGNGTAQNLYDGDLLNPIDLQITTELQFDHGYLEGIPTLWGPAVLEMRIWV